MSEWISTKDKLPPEGKYVIAKHNRGTWIDKQDQENVNTVIVKLVRGISMDEREKMKSGDIPETTEQTWCLSDGIKNTKRSSIYMPEDEQGNNLVPYYWKEFGSDSFFGQTITHWTPIPPL